MRKNLSDFYLEEGMYRWDLTLLYEVFCGGVKYGFNYVTHTLVSFVGS